MDYDAAVDALASRGRFGISLGLERVSAILDELGHPEQPLRGALVAGTNGKGSVVALVGAVLHAAGLRTGTMPKPHLVSYRERIAIDGVPIARDRFAAAVERVLPAVDAVAARLGAPTEFEVLTAAAVTELARSGVDLAVIEVGLGGRLDATNVLDLGVAAITNVQHDHERYLGSTLAAIGTEKAAIIKGGDLAVTGASGRGLAPIVARSATVGAPLRRAGPRQPYRAVVRALGWDGLVVDARTPTRRLSDLRIALLGAHQAANAAVALAVLEAMAERHDLRLTDAAIRAGFGAARWPGRLEALDDPRLGRVLLDGAHNPAGARALASALADLGLRGMPLIFGAMRGKRVDRALRALAAAHPRPIFTAVDDPAALTPGELLATWRRLAPGGAAVDGPVAALERAAQLRRGDEPIVVAGSLYLVGAVRGLLRGEEGA
jgi:dihydrofolate synthase/folylpolyglutamate synthase